MITITHLSKRYGTRQALADVNLELKPGTVTLLLGANGAGKSSLLRCLLGITSFEGSVSVGGLDPLSCGCAVRSTIGYMPQAGGLHLDLTVVETMEFYADIRGTSREAARALLADVGLAEHAAARVGELSGGMRQRLGLAVALQSDPQILVLDEPSASLDSASRRWMAAKLRALADEGRTVLVSTHAAQELLDRSDCQVTLEAGRVADATTKSAAAARVAAGLPWPERSRRQAHPSPKSSKLGSVLPILRKELRDAFRNGWLIAYTLLMATLGLAATATGLNSTSGLAIQAFGRTTATLMNLCLLLSPLVAVLMGAGAIAGEQERGTLEHLLAQPVSPRALLLGKYTGLVLALTAATVAGFLPAGILIGTATDASMLAHYLLFPAIAALAGLAMAGIGLLISVMSRSAVQAQGTAVFAWFAFVLLYDLLLMGALALSGISAGWLAATLVVNPVDAARVLGVLALEPDLYLLGPAGALLTARFSPAGTAVLLLGALIAWSVVPVMVAALRFSIPLTRMRSHEKKRIGDVARGRRARRGDCVHVQG